MNYIGSKLRLSSFIYGAVTQVAGEDLSSYSFCDLFAGTGTVGKLFQGKVKKITSNDRSIIVMSLTGLILVNNYPTITV